MRGLAPAATHTLQQELYTTFPKKPLKWAEVAKSAGRLHTKQQDPGAGGSNTSGIGTGDLPPDRFTL